MLNHLVAQQRDATNRDALIAYEIADSAAARQSPGEDAYAAALRAVQTIDARLAAGYHYRSVDGRLLTTLEEVIRAITDGGLKVADGEKVA